MIACTSASGFVSLQMCDESFSIISSSGRAGVSPRCGEAICTFLAGLGSASTS